MLNRKVAIVTGAASGIGLEISKGLSQSGAIVIMADVNNESLIYNADLLKCDYYTADLSIRKSCKELVDYVIGKYNRIDILVNVAGVQNVFPIEDFPEDKWDFMMSLMLTAPFLLTKYVWKSMKDNGWGRIINMSSIHGLVASEYKAAYVSAKHGIIGLTRTAAMEGGAVGITCNAICPAYVKTPLVEKQIKAQAEHHGISEEKVISEIMLQKSSIKQLIPFEAIVNAVLFLCSEEASTITGIAFSIDGGWTAN